jgi:hypothetical protein
VIYRNNVGKKCHDSDIAVNPAMSCGPPACNPGYTMPVGWVNPAANDFHLTSSSIAIDKGTAEYAPPTDRDGKPRNGPPDAGAYEYSP